MICTLPDETRIRYSLKKRGRDPNYLVCFRGPDRKRKERSTKEPNMRRAEISAQAIIRRVYSQPSDTAPSWDDAKKILREHFRAANLRDGSIAAYLSALNLLREVYPETYGPADITPIMAEGFKVARSRVVSPRTLRSNLQHLSVVFGHWLKRIIASDPFASVDVPREDEKDPVLVEREKFDAFIRWLIARWEWRLPILFLEVQRAIGCRISELASATPAQLRDGRIYFTSETTKGRRDRACKISPIMFKELLSICGENYVFERFADELRAIHVECGRGQYAKRLRDFTPTRFRLWIEENHRLYFEQTKVEHWKLHTATRGAAMTRARMNGVMESDAALYFGCHPLTMHKYYLALNKERLADAVYEKMESGEKVGRPA
jgi:hypothetical protein